MTEHMVELPAQVGVVNVGLPLFAAAVADQDRPVSQVEWRIPADGDPEVVAALRRLFGPHAAAIDEANAEVLRRLDSGTPTLTGIRPASEVLDLPERTVLHPGPAMEVADACDPLRRSMRAAVVAEGWAPDVAAADHLLATGDVRLLPANELGAVVPMATAMGPRTPVWVVEVPEGGTVAYAPLGQGTGQVAWFGQDSPDAVARLVFLREAVAPVLTDALRAVDPVDVFSFAAQAVAMGDDVHVRTQASTNLLLRHLLPGIVGSDHPRRVEVAAFLSANYLLFLTLAMAGGRALTAWGSQVEGSSVVTTMARNGTELGIRLAGDDTWFLAPAPPVEHALYHPGKGPEDGAPDIGDSAVLELVGLGGAAAAGSPAVGQLLGGLAAAVELTADLGVVSVGRSSRLTLPTQGGQGTPLALDARAVVEHGITPRITTGILHNSDGSGQIGAGVATAPVSPFREAVLGLDRRLSRVVP